MPYKLLVITVSMDRSELALYIGLKNAGVDIEIMCAPDSDRQIEATQSGIRLDHLNVRHRLDYNAVSIIRRRMAEKNFDIVYAPRNDCLSAAIIAAGGSSVKIVGYRGTMGHISYWNPGALLTYLNPGVDKIVCVSRAVEAYLKSKRIPAKKLATIYKGHDVSWYGHQDTDRPLPFDIPEDAFVVGFVGNIRPVKGVEILLRSFQYLPESADIRYLIIGDIRDPKIKKAARRFDGHPKIHFAGFRPDAAALMASFDVFVMPSLKREGLPKAVIEAMAQGIAPIVTDVGGMPEIVVDRKSGRVVPPGNPRKLAEAILDMAGNPGECRQIGEQARKRIETAFNIDDTIKKTIELHQGLLET